MVIWKKETDLKKLNRSSVDTVITQLGIKYTEIGDNYLQGTMPVDVRTIQPYGLLHGGASVVLAETLGSVAANLAVDDDFVCVGTEINASHLRSVRTGIVTGTAKVVRLGRSAQVWQIDITDPRGYLICTSRLTVAVITHPTKEKKKGDYSALLKI